MKVKTINRRYWLRKVRIQVVKFPLSSVDATIVWANKKTETVSSMARRAKADLAVNASFFWDGLVMGRHVRDGKAVFTYDKDYASIILDNWKFDSWFEGGVKRLMDVGVKNAFSSYPYLIYGGSKMISKHPKSLAGPHPRSAIGITDDDQMVVVTVDVSSRKRYKGVTTKELAQILWDEGVRKWGINLDGGGSSTLWLQGHIINRPSDGRERPVVNALCFKVRK